MWCTEFTFPRSIPPPLPRSLAGTRSITMRTMRIMNLACDRMCVWAFFSRSHFYWYSVAKTCNAYIFGMIFFYFCIYGKWARRFFVFVVVLLFLLCCWYCWCFGWADKFGCYQLCIIVRERERSINIYICA